MYDLEVAGVHNYVANGVVVHNSQLLKRASVVAPKARYVSGKGVSGAGLCVAPHSMLMTNPGGIEAIKEVIDERLTNPQRISNFAWKQEHVGGIKIQGMSHDLKLKSKCPKSVWKLDAPKIMYSIVLFSGKSAEVTPNTKLFTMEEGKAVWKKSSELSAGDYIATPRYLIGGNIEHASTADFIDANPVVHDVKPLVKAIVEKLAIKHSSTRKAAKELGISELSLYHTW